MRRFGLITGVLALALLSGCSGVATDATTEREQWRTDDTSASEPVSGHEAKPVDPSSASDENRPDSASESLLGQVSGDDGVPEYTGYVAEGAGLFDEEPYFANLAYDIDTSTLTLSLMTSGTRPRVTVNGHEFTIVSYVDAPSDSDEARQCVTYEGMVEDAAEFQMTFGNVTSVVDASEAYESAGAITYRVTLAAGGQMSQSNADEVCRAVAVLVHGLVAGEQSERVVSPEAYDASYDFVSDGSAVRLEGEFTNKSGSSASGVRVGFLLYVIDDDGKTVRVESVFADLGRLKAGETKLFSVETGLTRAESENTLVEVTSVLGL